MTIISAFVLIFTVFAWSRVVLRYRDREISFRALIFWSLIWVSVLLATFYQQLSSNIAQIVGIERGLDFAIFVSVLLLFYLVFRLYIKMDRLDKDITALTIKLTRRHKKSKIEKRGG